MLNIADFLEPLPPIDFEVDPLACAVAQGDKKYKGVGLKSLEEFVTKDDRDQANTIRKYYLKKYFWAKLQGFEPSEFKSNVTRLLSIDSDWAITERDIGLFVRLVDFYAEDTTYDRLQQALDTREDSYQFGPLEKTVDLEYVCKTYRAQTNQKAICYWFKDCDNLLYQLKTKKTPYSAMLESALTTSRKYNLTVRKMHIAAMNFYDILEINESVL